MTGVFILKNLHKEYIHSLTHMLAWGHKALISIHRNDVRGIINSSHCNNCMLCDMLIIRSFDKILKFLSLTVD